MSNDPFAPPAPQGDPWANEGQAQQNAPQQAPQRSASVPPGEGEGKVVVTFKGGTGFDAPWIVIHAEDASDALGQLDGKLAELMQKTAQVAKYFHGQLGGARPPQGGGQSNGGGGYQQSGGQPGRPDNANQAPNGQGEYCQHGAMVFRSGVNAQSGKAWQGHFCPQPKGSPDQCKPKFGK